MKPDRRRFPLSADAEALLRTPGWERLELADGDAAQALCPGIRRDGDFAAHGLEIGPADDIERDTDTPDLFGD